MGKAEAIQGAFSGGMQGFQLGLNIDKFQQDTRNAQEKLKMEQQQLDLQRKETSAKIENWKTGKAHETLTMMYQAFTDGNLEAAELLAESAGASLDARYPGSAQIWKDKFKALAPDGARIDSELPGFMDSVRTGTSFKLSDKAAAALNRIRVSIPDYLSTQITEINKHNKQIQLKGEGDAAVRAKFGGEGETTAAGVYSLKQVGMEPITDPETGKATMVPGISSGRGLTRHQVAKMAAAGVGEKVTDKINARKASIMGAETLLAQLETGQIDLGKKGWLTTIKMNTTLNKVFLGIPKRDVDPEDVNFYRNTETVFQLMRTAVTGAQAAMQEITYLRTLMPDMLDSPEQFALTLKMNSLINTMANVENLYDEARMKSGGEPEVYNRIIAAGVKTDLEKRVLAKFEEAAASGQPINLREITAAEIPRAQKEAQNIAIKAGQKSSADDAAKSYWKRLMGKEPMDPKAPR